MRGIGVWVWWKRGGYELRFDNVDIVGSTTVHDCYSVKGVISICRVRLASLAIGVDTLNM